MKKDDRSSFLASSWHLDNFRLSCFFLLMIVHLQGAFVTLSRPLACFTAPTMHTLPSPLADLILNPRSSHGCKNSSPKGAIKGSKLAHNFRNKN